MTGAEARELLQRLAEIRAHLEKQKTGLISRIEGIDCFIRRELDPIANQYGESWQADGIQDLCGLAMSIARVDAVAMKVKAEAFDAECGVVP